MELEGQLMDQLRDPKRAVVMLQCGIRAQGKTTKMTAILRWCLDNNTADEYFLIAPSFIRDANHGYAWLHQNEYKGRVFVLTDYTPMLSEFLFKRKTPLPKAPCGVWMS